MPPLPSPFRCPPSPPSPPSLPPPSPPPLPLLPLALHPPSLRLHLSLLLPHPLPSPRPPLPLLRSHLHSPLLRHRRRLPRPCPRAVRTAPLLRERCSCSCPRRPGCLPSLPPSPRHHRRHLRPSHRSCHFPPPPSLPLRSSVPCLPPRPFPSVRSPVLPRLPSTHPLSVLTLHLLPLPHPSLPPLRPRLRLHPTASHPAPPPSPCPHLPSVCPCRPHRRCRCPLRRLLSPSPARPRALHQSLGPSPCHLPPPLSPYAVRCSQACGAVPHPRCPC
mmetsp:Transcript_22224/g.87563  ORF Transcript_22224/g.87563 Transcript_22224/m.87563 type:complete len:274 (-) Transcript_22224:690-1511(-)